MYNYTLLAESFTSPLLSPFTAPMKLPFLHYTCAIYTLECPEEQNVIW